MKRLASGLLLAILACELRAQCASCSKPSFGRVFRGLPSLEVVDVAAGDLDGDGIPDLVTANRFNGISVYRGTGTGSFLDPIVRPSADMSHVVVTDVNGDGQPDVVAAGANISVFLGNGDGTLQPAIEFAPQPLGYDALASGDFDGDGIPDLAVNSHLDGIHIYLGNGDGTFHETAVAPAFGSATSFVLADFNGDGHLDIAGGNETSGNLTVYLGDGRGGFVTLPPGPFVGSLAVGDFNGDGVPDLVSGNFNDVEVLIGSGDGTFSVASSYPGGNGPNSVVTGDFNRDGILDVLFATEQDGTITVLPGHGDGTFGSPSIELAGDGFGRLAVADFDANGSLDVALVSFDIVEVLLSDGTGTFPPYPVISTGGVVGPVVLASLTGSGFIDMAIANTDRIFGATPGQLAVLPGDGSGAFGAPVILSLAAPATRLLSGFIDGDSRLDLVASTQAGIQVILSDGSGAFHVLPPFGGGAYWVEAGDVNLDGRPDLVVTGISGFQIYLNNGDGTFSPASSLPGLELASGIAIRDFNGDGKPDLAVADHGLRIFLGHGDGTFSPGASYLGTFEDNYGHMASGDFDGDGNVDLVIVRFTADLPFNVEVYFGKGDGTFEAPVLFSAGDYAIDVVAADINGDGRPDILVSTETSVRVLASNGDRTFTASDWIKPLPGIGPIAVGDVDGDGRPDIAINNPLTGGEAAVFHNTICIPTRLAMASQPHGCSTANAPLPGQPVVHVVDDGDNVVCDNGIVSASLLPGTGTAGATLSGSAAVAAVNGTATFTDLSVDRDGRGYRLDFSHTSVTSTESRTFTQGMSVDISGPRLGCALTPLTLRTGSGGYDRYVWSLDGSPVSRAEAVALTGLSPGTHALGVTVFQDGCTTSSSASVSIGAAPSLPVIVAPTLASPLTAGLLASVPSQNGHSYRWSIEGGVITSGSGTSSITFTSGLPGTRMVVHVADVSPQGCESPEADLPVQVDFSDVAATSPFREAVDILGRDEITAGCGGGAFCPQDPVTRAQMAVFLLRAEHGKGFVPPPLGSFPFNSTMFADVRGGDFAAEWIQELGLEGITAGCGGGNYCPHSPTSRAEMAVFLLRTEHGSGYAPPPATGIFSDVPPGSFAAAWIDQLAREGITAGCGGSSFCPEAIVSRAQMAVFLVSTFNLR